jgi:hypothetical protein
MGTASIVSLPDVLIPLFDRQSGYRIKTIAAAFDAKWAPVARRRPP